MVSKNSAGPPPATEGLAELSARLHPSEQKGGTGKPQRAPKPERTPEERKALRGRIGRWGGAVTATLAGLTMFVSAGVINSMHEAELSELAQGALDARERTSAAQYAEEDLPDALEGARWLSQATEYGQQLAADQNTYLANTGPLPLDEVPKERPGPGDVDEVCSDYIEQAQQLRAEPYTDEERLACAEGIRTERISGLPRSMAPYLAASVRDEKGLNASSAWHEHLSVIDDEDGEVSLEGYAWSLPEVREFASDGNAEVVWFLRDTDTGQTLAWMRGSYDSISKTFSQMVLSEVSSSEDAVEEGIVIDDAESAEDEDDEATETDEAETTPEGGR